MRKLRGAAILVVATAVLATACGEDAVTDPPEGGPRPPAISAALVPLDAYGLGAGPRGCDSPAHREFDFWVGQWDVFGGSSANLVGTSVVKSRVDGCVVEENWTSAVFGRGRSLNAYDAATGTWTQMWVSSGGCPFGIILMEGGFADGSMTLRGVRTQPEGFLVAPPCSPPPETVVTTHTDLFRWTALPSGSVLQQIAAANDGTPLVPPAPPSTLQGLRYDPVARITPLAPADPSFCPFRAAARQFDYMLGTWRVHQGNGEGAQGTATFTTDLNTCLVEESFTGPGGFEGLSFNTFDVFTQQWYRTWVDSDGRRLIMAGGPDASGAMVLRGSRPGAGGRSIEVRITWRPSGPDEVVQRWEYSRDGGGSWKRGQEIRYTRS
ncbi:MAG TPA: hypothetical protein VEB59_04570 [Gemmatimonadales bacterium]|nr:hypothetical protein [Gemmatimonadales bacterium]